MLLAAVASTLLTLLPIQDPSPAPWTERALLRAPAPDAADYYGRAVAISGDTIVVGSFGESSGSAGVGGDMSDNTLARSGAAFVYVRGSEGWKLQAFLKASTPGANDLFGVSVAISGDTIVVGAQDEAGEGDEYPGSGAAYVFVRSAGLWSPQATLRPSTPARDRKFGCSVAVDGETIVVGANGDATRTGAAYVFVRSGGGWSEQAALRASNGGPEDYFGSGVGISGDTVVVGANAEDGSARAVNGASDDSADGAGAAYVFVRSGTAWAEHSYLKAFNAEAKDGFGYSVAISGERIVVGAIAESGGPSAMGGDGSDNSQLHSGAAYVFRRSAGAWTQESYLKASNAEGGTTTTSPLNMPDHFGRSVAIAGDVVVVGATGEDSAATTVNGDPANNAALQAGAAYVFVRGSAGWSQQAYLKASTAGATDFFGWGLGVSGPTIVAGAYLDDGPGESLLNSGSAFVFKARLALPPAPVADQRDAYGQGIAAGGATHGVIRIEAPAPAGPFGSFDRLEVEIKPVGIPFDGWPLRLGPALNSVHLSDLPFGDYHWRARFTNDEGSSPWAGFGNNDEISGIDVTRYNTAPVTGDPVQLRNGEILPGGRTLYERESLDFRVAAVDPDGDDQVLELELVEAGRPFTGTATHRSDPGRHHQRFALIVEPELGSWRWQVRVVDPFGASSGWKAFGTEGDASPDFSVVPAGSLGEPISAPCTGAAGPAAAWAGLVLLLPAFRRRS